MYTCASAALEGEILLLHESRLANNKSHDGGKSTKGWERGRDRYRERGWIQRERGSEKENARERERET
jgi:hypothetical protein